MEHYHPNGAYNNANNLLAPPQWIQSKLLQRKQCTLYEQRKLAEAVLYFSRLSIDDIRQCLHSKPIDSFIDSIPYSLPLLETVYSKFYLYDKHEFPTNLLKPDKLIGRLVAYFVQEYCRINNEAKRLSSPSNNNYADDWITIEPRVKNLLKTIHDCCPNIVSELKMEKRRLDTALEGLGLHGLVNFGDRTLIELPEAVKQELQDHQHRVKAFFQKVDKTVHKSPRETIAHANGGGASSHCVYSINGGRGPVPVKSSHQRLMNMRLSDIKNRLQRNENLHQLIKSSLTNVDLENLSRILQKRIRYDQTLLNEMNCLLKSAPGVVVLPFLTTGHNDDPVASHVLVVFGKAYEKLFGLLPNVKADDSGLGDDDDNGLLSDSNTATTSTKAPDSSSRFGSISESVYSQQRDTVNATKSSVNDLRRHSNGYCKFTAKTPSLNNVSGELFKSCHDLYTCKSTQYLSKTKSPPPLGRSAAFRSYEKLDSANEIYQSKENMTHRFNNFRSPSEDSTVLSNDNNYQWLKMELNRCQAENDRLKREIINANRRQDSSNIYGYHQSNGHDKDANYERELIDRYNSLYNNERVDAMHELKQLNELENSEELQWKILLSVIVLSFRAVHADFNESLEDVFKLLHLNENPTENGVNAQEAIVEFRKTLGHVMLHKSRQTGYSKSIKTVSEQIWQTLFDYPSLKVCKKFNVFIKCCVQIAWESTFGKIRFSIDYEGDEFNVDKHNRLNKSNFKSKSIRRFVWPALVEDATQKYVCRALVVT